MSTHVQTALEGLAEAPPAGLASRARPRRAARVVIQCLLGLALGLLLAESTFRWRDGGAFPLLNVYEPDASRGVRLRPGGRTVVGQRGQRITQVRVNQDGYRGDAWPAPSASEVVIVGDSMSFGLGVEDGEALGPRLREALGGTQAVIDASVPTYGPHEYLITMEQVLAARRPDTDPPKPGGAVVFVINLLNDFGEIDRPNPERHAVLDGWAIRRAKGAAPKPSSRAREIAIRHSHAAFALWRWQRTREAIAAPPEPDHGIRDLLDLAAARRVAAEAIAAARARGEPQGLGLVGLGEPFYPYARLPRRAIFALVRKYAKAIAASGQGFWDPAWNAHLDDDHLDGRPTWIAWCGWGAGNWEEVRVNQAAQDAHRKMIEALRRYAAWSGADPAITREVEEASKKDAPQSAAEAKPAPVPEMPPLPIENIVRRAQYLAHVRGAKLVVVTVPLDAQASVEARDRHGLTAAEVTSLDGLVGDLTVFAGQAEAFGVDPSEALRRLGAAAYLPDGHLSAAGHEAVAQAVAAAVPRAPATGE